MQRKCIYFYSFHTIRLVGRRPVIISETRQYNPNVQPWSQNIKVELIVVRKHPDKSPLQQLYAVFWIEIRTRADVQMLAFCQNLSEQYKRTLTIILCRKHTIFSTNEIICTRKCRQTYKSDCQCTHSYSWGLWKRNQCLFEKLTQRNRLHNPTVKPKWSKRLEEKSTSKWSHICLREY